MIDSHLDAYLSRHKEKLLRRRDEMKAERENAKKGTIEQELSSWWEQLPECQRQEYYTMEFFLDLISVIYGRRRSSAKVGSSLFSIGFRKKRIWSSGPVSRIWVPP